MTTVTEDINFYEGATQETQETEARRLREQATYYGQATKDNLGPRLGEFMGGQLLDIGAGTATEVQELCTANSVGYIALDINENYLSERPPGAVGLIRARSNQLPVANNSIDITHSRATTAWSKEPEASIAEQLRVTRPGGLAVFTEFDWSEAKAAKDSPIADTINAARHIMRLALRDMGYISNYGAKLSYEVSRILTNQGITFDGEDVIYRLGQGDYRDYFLGDIKTLLSGMRENKSSMVSTLESEMKVIENSTEPLVMNLPTLVSKIVRIKSKRHS